MRLLNAYIGQLNFNISLDGSLWLLVSLIILALAFCIYIYQQTTPPTSSGFRIALLVIRSIALISLMSLLFHPILQIRDEYVQKPDVAVLVDNSKSLQIEDSGIRRSDFVQDLIKPKHWESLNDQFNLHFFPFQTDIDTNFTLNDTLRFDGEGTDISRALDLGKKRLLNGFYTSAVLISDGNYNTGENPEFFAQRYQVPIHVIGVGDASKKKDIIVERVVTNEVVYTNNRVPVDVTLKQEGFKDKRVDLLLKQGNNVIDRQLVKLGESGQEQKIRLFFTPDEAGFLEYSIEVPVLDDEFTPKNNFRNIIVKVLESKINILLIAGEASLDLRFLQRAFEDDENIQVSTLVQKKGGGFYSKKGLSAILKEDYQLFIFLGFPRRPIANTVMNYLNERLSLQKKPVFFIQAPQMDLGALGVFSDFLPFRPETNLKSPREVVVGPTTAGENTPVVLISDNHSENRQIWNNLPPISTFRNNFKPTSDSEILLQVEPSLSNLPNSQESRMPILVSRLFNDQKSLALMGYGIWRWDLMMWGAGKTNTTLLKFLQRAVRWLITRDEAKQVKFATDKLIYHSGEQVYVQAQVYTQDYQPVEGALVQLSVKHSDDRKDYVLKPIGNGKYETQFRVFQGGDYQFWGDAWREDKFFGADSGKFSAGQFEIEFQQTRMNEEMLQRIAQVSGGTYLTADTFQQLENELNSEGRVLVKNREINLWNEWFSLIVPIFVLAVEWTLRRRRGML